MSDFKVEYVVRGGIKGVASFLQKIFNFQIDYINSSFWFCQLESFCIIYFIYTANLYQKSLTALCQNDFLLVWFGIMVSNSVLST